MKKIYPILLIFLSSCGESEKPPAPIAPELKPYFDEFLFEAGERSVSPDLSKLESIEVTYSPTHPLGRCSNGRVVINLRVAMGDVCKVKVAMFHELGHCLLGKKHTPPDGGVHIMQPVIESACAVYLLVWEELLDELFR